MTTKPEPADASLAALLRRHRLLAIVRGSCRRAALDCALTLVADGDLLVEVSLTTDDALWVIQQARDRLGPESPLGAGTATTAADVRNAVGAGASFIVTPALTESVDEAVRRHIPVVAGALTPTEVAGAVTAGAAVVKLFPASLGGVAYLRALREPFPGVAFVPTGGVSLADAPQFLAAGAAGVGMGSPLVGDAADGGDLTDLQERLATVKRALL